MEVAEVREGLESFIPDTFGSDARIENLIESDGHAGLTFLFEVATRAGSTPYVIKLPPKGVTRKGNTDVYRQAPLLRALYDAGLPVPNVPWAYDENGWFEIPFIVMERLAGKTFFVWDPAPGLPRDTATARGYYEQCAVWLARIHQFDWKHSLADWETPIDLEKD
ncbi:MAG: phosphotransferase, partial [Gammaproteobacteria bacterium]